MDVARSKSVRSFTIERDRLPNLPAMMLAVIAALKSIGGSATIYELDEKVADLERVSEEEQALAMANEDPRPRFNYYLAWARTYLKRGGALANSARAVWSLTDSGSNISTLSETKSIYERVNAEERERTRQRKAGVPRGDAPPAQTETPEPGEPEGEENWRSSLLAILGKMTPAAFERLAQRLLREAGFTKVEVRGRSGDGGVDGVGLLRMNLVTFQVYFQCKRWKGGVGPGEIRDFRGAMIGRADKGLFVTTGHFTSGASDEATRDGATAIDLIDGERLCELLKDNRLGVRTEMVESVSLDPSFFEAI